MDKIISLIVRRYVSNVFNFSCCLMDLGCLLLRGLFHRRLRRRAATLPLFLEKISLSLISSSSCEEAAAVMDWTICVFVWVRLRNQMFRPGERSGIPVVARPTNRRCCRHSTCRMPPSC